MAPRSKSTKAKELLDEHAKPAVGSVLSPHRISQADALTPARLGAIMRDADQGIVEAYLTLAEEMEEREPHYRSVLSTRRLGVSGLPMEVEAANDSADAKAIAEDVELIVRRPQFRALVKGVMDAVSKGFSCVEIMWSRDANRWEPTHYKFRPQRHFVFDKDSLETPRLRSLTSPLEGEELAPFKWIVHKPDLLSGVPVRTGLARTIAVCYAAKRYTVADWLAFLDVFGMPIRVGKYPASMQAKKRELLNAVRRIGTDAAAVIPQEMEIEFIESKGGAGGTTLFQQSAEYWDKQISKVVLGQTMTSDDGSSLAQSKTHERVRFDIRSDDAQSVADTINRDLIEAFVTLNYGEQPDNMPRVKFISDEPEDTKTLMDSVRVFVNLGGKVQMSEVRDRLGLAEPDEDAELLMPEAQVKAAHTPKPEPVEGDEPGNDDEPTEPDDDVPARELNSRQRFAKQGTADVVDDLEASALEDWRPLLDENVGVLLSKIQGASSFEEAKTLLEQLAKDEGEELALNAITALLSRSTFKVRGVGDATDKTEGV